MAHQSQLTPSTTKCAPTSSEMHLAEDEAAVLLLGLRRSGGPASSSSSPQPQPSSSSSCSVDGAVASTSKVKLDEMEPPPKSSSSPCATPVRVIEGRLRRASLTRSQSDEDARRVRGRKNVKEEEGKRDEEEEEGDTSSSADAHLRRGSRHRKQVERPNMVKTPGAGLYKGTSHRKRHSSGHARGSTAAAKAELNGVSVSCARKRQGPKGTADLTQLQSKVKKDVVDKPDGQGSIAGMVVGGGIEDARVRALHEASIDGDDRTERKPVLENGGGAQGPKIPVRAGESGPNDRPIAKVALQAEDAKPIFIKREFVPPRPLRVKQDQGL